MCPYMMCLIIQYLKRAIGILKDKILIVLAIYTIGLLLGLLLYFLRFLNWVYAGWGIKVQHWERFPKRQKRVLVVSNHPSLLEVVLVPALFFRDYILHPFDFSPWNIPDKKNYFDRWYWAWAKIRLVPIDRENNREAFKALRLIKKILNLGNIVILFPEGGRTFKGEEFFYSEKGRKIRKLKAGVGWLVLKTNPLIVPVWIDGAEKVLPNKPDKLYHCLPNFCNCVTVKIGKPINIQGKNKEEITQEIVLSLLKLADEEE